MAHAAAFDPPVIVPLKTVALPAEHGGWGLVAEPVLVGLAVAPDAGALGVAVAVVGGFLLHHPAKLVLADLRRGRTYPRTRVALVVAAVYALVAAAGLALAVSEAESLAFVFPLAAAAPVALVQLAYDATHRSRQVVPELAGAVALAAAAPAEMLAFGWSATAAAAVFVFLAGRGAASVLYVRARLRRARAMPAGLVLPLGAHLAFVGAVLAIVAAGRLPVAAAIAGFLLLGRAAWGLSARQAAVAPQVVGWQEVVWGLVTVALLVAGYHL